MLRQSSFQPFEVQKPRWTYGRQTDTTQKKVVEEFDRFFSLAVSNKFWSNADDHVSKSLHLFQKSSESKKKNLGIGPVTSSPSEGSRHCHLKIPLEISPVPEPSSPAKEVAVIHQAISMGVRKVQDAKKVNKDFHNPKKLKRSLDTNDFTQPSKDVLTDHHFLGSNPFRENVCPKDSSRNLSCHPKEFRPKNVHTFESQHIRKRFVLCKSEPPKAIHLLKNDSY